MKLLKISEFRKRCFADSPPTLKTIRNWIDTGQLPGTRIGTNYFVDLEAMAKHTEAENDPLVKKVLAG